jgi:hypothetical protein
VLQSIRSEGLIDHVGADQEWDQVERSCVDDGIVLKLKTRVEKASNETKFVIIDGFLLYHDAALLPLYDIKLFLSADPFFLF